MIASETFCKMYFIGEVTISGAVMIDIISDLNGASPQFTLTCISIGGPATTVTWTRDSVTVTEETETVLNDQEEAQYTHTLTVTGRMGGLYTCTVTNDVTPAGASDTLTIQGTNYIITPRAKPNMCSSVSHTAPDPLPPTNLKAEAGNDLTSILLTWTPSSGANGYIISYDNRAGSSGTVTVDGGSTDSRILTGLQSGTTYNISMLATSIHFNSDSVQFDPVELVERK